MGGFAAILFGGSLNADEVHTFSPQTFISGSKRKLFADSRWETEIKKIHKSKNIGEKFFDLSDVINLGHR